MSVVATLAVLFATDANRTRGAGPATNTSPPTGYWVDVDESGTTTSANLGGSGSLQASGQGNVNYGFAEECAPSQDGGPFSIGHYPPQTCAQTGRPLSSTGSPEQPSGFWFTGNQNCVNAGRPFSGATFTWHVQLPASGQWHVDVYVPSWTSYGFGDQYILAADDGQFANTGFTQQAYHGSWVTLFGPHTFTAGQDYTVGLTLADGADSYCHYQMADQMRWVFDSPATPPGPTTCPPGESGTPPNCITPTPTGTRAPPSITGLNPGNGSVTVSWAPPSTWSGSPITSYQVTAIPAGNDRVPAPSISSLPTVSVPATSGSARLPGLIEDCHQLYRVNVAPVTGAGSGPAAVTPVFRPSGIVIPHVRPPYVVVVLDGIASHQAGFSMDPYQPTPNVGPAAGPPSYCPENVDVAGHPLENAFTPHPAGPAEFFAKWNYYDPTDKGSGNQSNSTPRNLSTGTETRSFMFDAIAATGSMILPYSYWGATLQGHGRSDPTFVYNAYTGCNSTPLPYCDPKRDAGGKPDPGANDPSNVKHSFSLSEDEQRLKTEIDSIEQVWPNEPIIVVGHSQGGLIAFETWRKHMLPGAVRHLFSLDSPINGVCIGGKQATQGHCIPFVSSGYPDFDQRLGNDRTYFGQDGGPNYVFRFIGTFGDQVRFRGVPSYGTGNETLQHQLLVKGPNCDTHRQSDCPGPWDHVTEFAVPEGAAASPKNPQNWLYEDGHFVVKFYPGDVRFFNQVLGLSY